MLDDLLLYQEEDGKLRAIEMEIAATDERKKYLTAKKYLEKAPEKLSALEAHAAQLGAEYDRLQKKCAELEESLQDCDYDSIEEIVDEQGGSAGYYRRNVSQILTNIRLLKDEINRLNASMQRVKSDYASLKKQTIGMQRQYKEYKDKYDRLQASRKGEKDALAENMKAIAGRISPEMLKRYTAKRKERLYPVVCEVTAERCPQCGMELSIAEQAKLSSGKLTECDSCRRILFRRK